MSKYDEAIEKVVDEFWSGDASDQIKEVNPKLYNEMRLRHIALLHKHLDPILTPKFKTPVEKTWCEIDNGFWYISSDGTSFTEISLELVADFINQFSGEK